MIQEEQLINLVNRFSEITVTVAGDIMLDKYVEGRVERISPEAPVPVVDALKKDARPGGAGNVAMNLIALGAQVNICAVSGSDDNGDILRSQLAEAGMETKFIHPSPSRITTAKTRIIGNNIQLIRVDEEQTDYLSAADEERCLELLFESLETSQALLFEDYDKGYLTPSLIDKAIEEAKRLNLTITVDPKVRGFWHYHDVTLFKPNLKELRTGLNIGIDPSNPSELKSACNGLRKKLNNQYSLITLSDKGVYAEAENNAYSIPAHRRNIADVSGAGDSVIAVATLCLAAGADLELSAALANIAGGLACEFPGVIPVNKKMLLDEAIKTLIK